LSCPSFDSSLIIECDEFDVKFDDRFEDEFSRDVATSSLLPLGMSGRALVSLVRSCRRCKVWSFDSDGRKISILDDSAQLLAHLTLNRDPFSQELPKCPQKFECV
jgi:hypothetical protein